MELFAGVDRRNTTVNAIWAILASWYVYLLKTSQFDRWETMNIRLKNAISQDSLTISTLVYFNHDIVENQRLKWFYVGRI